MNKNEKNTRRDLILEYIKKNPPYESQGDLGIDIRALSKYARDYGKAPADLAPEEVEQFRTE